MTLEDFLAAWPNCASPDCGYKGLRLGTPHAVLPVR